MHTTKAMRLLEQQFSEIVHVMYDSVTKQNFDRVSDDIDRVLGAVDNDFDKINTDSIRMPYDNVNNITTCTTKYERNMTNISKDTDTKDMVPHDRDDNMMTKVKLSIETNDIDNRFLRECDNMHKLMEDRQITDYYEAQKHIQSAMMGNTPVKTVQNRQYIDNVSNCTIPVPVIVLCLPAIFVCNINNSELHFQSVAPRSQDHAPEAVMLH